MTAIPTLRSTMSDNNSVPQAQSTPAGQTDTKPNDPSPSDEGKSSENNAEAHSKIPENLQNKSVEDVVKMYGELERKLGEQSTSVAEAKKIKENQQILARAVQDLSESDPDTIKKLESAIAKVTGSAPTETKKQETDGEPKADPQVSELRQVTVNKSFDEFASRHGISKMGDDEKKKVMEKVGQELMDLYDPGGNKQWQQVLSEIPLAQLPTLLDKAYYLSAMGTAQNRSQTDFASVGSMPSSNQESNVSDVSLTPDEKKLAQMLGVSEEKWLKRKQEKQEQKNL